MSTIQSNLSFLHSSIGKLAINRRIIVIEVVRFFSCYSCQRMTLKGWEGLEQCSVAGGTLAQWKGEGVRRDDDLDGGKKGVSEWKRG